MSEEASAPVVEQTPQTENQEAEAATTEEKQQQEEQPKNYKCPQCRFILFTDKDIIPHEATKARKFINKRNTYSDKDNEHTSLFIEKPEWLNALGRNNDTIYCPKCNYKVGHFNWKGSQCSCGEWVKPSFQFPLSRIDQI